MLKIVVNTYNHAAILNIIDFLRRGPLIKMQGLPKIIESMATTSKQNPTAVYRLISARLEIPQLFGQ